MNTLLKISAAFAIALIITGFASIFINIAFPTWFYTNNEYLGNIIIGLTIGVFFSIVIWLIVFLIKRMR